MLKVDLLRPCRGVDRDASNAKRVGAQQAGAFKRANQTTQISESQHAPLGLQELSSRGRSINSERLL